MLRLRGYRIWPSLNVIVLAGVCLLVLALCLDRLFPLRLPADAELFARVVTDSSGRPLRAFPDGHGVWRYPIALDEVSPL